MKKSCGVLILLLAAAAGGRAEEGNKIRFFVGVSGMSTALEGDFKGNAVLTKGSEAIAVPSFDRAFGAGVHAGFRRFSSHPVDPGLELVYTRTAMDGDLNGASFDATYHTIGADAKLFFNVEGAKTWQPFLMGGIFIPWLNVEDGATDLSTTGDADFSGMGYNLGGGFSLALGRQVALDFTAAFRLTGFTTVEGVRDRDDIEDPLYSADFVPSIELKIFLN